MLYMLWVAGTFFGSLWAWETWTPPPEYTLPSAHYLKHPPQYFPPSLPFPLPKELEALEKAHAAFGAVPGRPALPGLPAHLSPFHAGPGSAACDTPPSCPIGGAKPRAVKADAQTIVQLEICVVEINRSALPRETFRWAEAQLGLTDDKAFFGIVKNREAAHALIRAMRKDGLAKVLSEPRIATLSGRSAYVISGGQSPILLPDKSIDVKGFGTKIGVRPVVKADGRIRLEVDIEITERDDLVRKRSATVRAEVAPEQTLAILGLAGKVNHRLPVLGDLPFVGDFFEMQTETQTMVLVTPRLVMPETAAPVPSRVAAPDVLVINASKLTPRNYKLGPLDVLEIETNSNPLMPSSKQRFTISPEGVIQMAVGGDANVSLRVAGLTLIEAEHKIMDLVIRDKKWHPVKVSLVELRGAQSIRGEHLVRPDGTISLGMYGTVHVQDKTLSEVKAAVEQHLSKYLVDPQVSVDVLAYNSRKIYLIHEGSNRERNVIALPAGENQTVLDVLAQNKQFALQPPSNIWVARPTPGKTDCAILPVDWRGITQGSGHSNFQVLPGDRIHLQTGKPTAGHVEECEPVPAPVRADRNKMTISDVVRMLKKGIAHDIILRQMELTDAVFNLTVDDIIELHDQRVSDVIIRAMQQRHGTTRTGVRTMRADQGTIETETLRQLHDEMRRFWLNNMPPPVNPKP